MLRLHMPDRPTEPLAAEVVAGGGAAIGLLPDADTIRRAVWVDLAFPLPSERASVEAALGVDLPTKADMAEIEASSRVYREGDAQVMNVLLVVGVHSEDPAAIPVSLILAPSRLITVRYADPTAFRGLEIHCTKTAPGDQPLLLLVRLLENIVDSTADILERMGTEIDSLSNLIFGRDRPKSLRLSTEDLQTILRRIGNTQFVLNKAHDSLVTLSRATNFLSAEPPGERGRTMRDEEAREARDSLRSLHRDIMSLSDNSNYLTQNVGFLLDAALGRISIEQNAIVKIFSVAAVIFLPPTLVASVYGMNFDLMPELHWEGGYPMALGLMVLSAVIPYLWFKRKGWL